MIKINDQIFLNHDKVLRSIISSLSEKQSKTTFHYTICQNYTVLDIL